MHTPEPTPPNDPVSEPESHSVPTTPPPKPQREWWRLDRLRTQAPKNLTLTLFFLACAAVAAGVARGDRQIRFPAGDRTTDDAFMRADITPLSSRVEGYVARVLVHDFERVKKGQVLVELDDADFVARVQRAEGRVQAAEAMLEANLRRQKLQRPVIEAASAAQLAAKVIVSRDALDAERHERLVQDGLVSQRDRERIVHDAERARAELKQRASERARASAELPLLDAERMRLSAELLAARAELDLARIELSWTKIVAPEDGVVSERGVRPGQLVRDGTQIIQFVDMDHVWVTANFKERQMAGLRPGHPVTFSVDGFPDRVLSGVVDSVAPASGSQTSLLPPDNATGNFTKIAQRVPVKITFDVPDELQGLLVPGMSVVVELAPRKL